MLFLDEATLHAQPSAAPQWHPKGRRQPPVRLACGPDRGVRAAALLSPSGEPLWETFPKFTAKRVADLYLRAARAFPQAERVTVVLDDWPVHFHERALRALKEDPRIELLGLPTYSPWLNPVEKAWRWLRQRMERNHPWAGDRAELERQAREELGRMRARVDELLRYVGLIPP